MTATLYKPARPGLSIPMPDRDNRPMPHTGAAVDIGKPYYRRLHDDGDIVEARHETARPARKRRPTRK
jgi:hypothetical protein